MSSTVFEGQPGRKQTVRRRVWLCAGTVLWGCVAIASVVLWRAQRADRLAAEQLRQAVLAQAETDAADSPFRVSSFSASEDGSIQVNLSELLSQKSASEDVSGWDPKGVDDFEFANCDGRTVTKADLLGRPWAICFVFTQCLGPCPTVTRQMKLLQDRLKQFDVRLVTLTVDPARDTPDVLLNYAKLNGADLNRWYFLRGDQLATYQLIQGSFRMPVHEITGPNRQPGFEIVHSTNVMLVDAQGVVRNKYNAAKDEEMAALRRDLQELAERLPSSAEPLIAEPSPPVADVGGP